MNHFFLSYARGDDDEYVQRFYSDLCREIRVHHGLPRGERVGFMDSASIRLGTEWSSELAYALTDCGVFLPLYAPGYFYSEWCGKEWAAFTRRLALHRGSPDTAGGFVPVVWLRPPFLPVAAQSLQYNSGAFGNAYAEYGLRQLIRLRRHEDDYQETVTALATEIVRIAGRYDPQRSAADLDLANLPSAFHPPLAVPTSPGSPPPAPLTAASPAALGRAYPYGLTSTGSGTSPAQLGSPRDRTPLEPATAPGHAVAPGPAVPTGSAGGGKRVHFVIASAGRDEMSAVRTSLACYGSTAQHWAPYRPGMAEPLGPYACEIAAGQQFRAELAGLDDLPERIDRANERNQIVVLLVDPWVAGMSGYGEALLDYDRRNEPTVPVLVALSDQDEETSDHRDTLIRSVADTFPNNSMRNDPIFRPEVRTPEQFADDLDQALQVAANRLMKRGTVFRHPPGPPARPRAILEAPDSFSNRRST